MDEPSDLSNIIASIQVQFRIQGLSWEHPRVKAWMERIGVTDHRQLPDRALISLSRHLTQNLAPPAVNEKQCGLIGDIYPAFYEIHDQSPHTRIELSFYGIPADRLQQWLEESLERLDDWLIESKNHEQKSQENQSGTQSEPESDEAA